MPPPSEPPTSLALDDIMIIEDDEEGNQNNSNDAKILDIQDQLQKQAEIIRDLLVQRDYLINQILQERDRWQAERDGWDRTSEALVSRHAKKDRDSDSGKEEELTHLCAVYESDNKALKGKLHDTQARLTDLETELSKLKPLLVMQPHLLPQPTRRPMSYSYAQMQSYISPFPHAPTQYAPVSSTTTPVSVNRGRKRRRGDYPVDPSSNKGKGKGGPSNEAGSDSNEDGDTDTEAPPTPTPSSSSWNPYAYMNDFNRQAASPTKPSPLKPPDVLSSPTISAYSVSYPYSYIVSPFSKQPSSSNSGASIPFRPDKADKDGGQGESNTDSQKDKYQPSPPKTTARRTMGTTTSRTQHQGKNKASTFLSDARAEHLLLAARRIGRERAAAIAGIVKVQDKSVVVPEEIASATKDRAKAKEQASGAPSSSTTKRSSPLKSRPTLIQSPSTPTPRRIHGPGDKMLLSSPLAHPSSSSIGTTSTARSRDTLVSSTRSVTRTLSTIASSNEDMAPASGQTPLDSLLSAARTMMSEDCEAPAHGHRLTVSDGAIGATDGGEDARRRQPRSQVEERDVEESIQRKKRRRNTTTTTITRSPATPRLRTITEKQRGNASTPRIDPDREINSTLAAKRVPAVIQAHSSAQSTQRTRSALDVLADQAAAASSDGGGGGVIGPTESSQSEVDDQGAGTVHERPDTESTPPSSASYSVPHLINDAGAPVDHRVPYRDETTQSGASSLPRLCSASDGAGAEVTTEYDTEANTNNPPLPAPLDRDNIALECPLQGAEAPPLPDTTIATTTASTQAASLPSKGSGDPTLSEKQSTNYPDRNRNPQDHGKPRKNNSEFHGPDPFGSRPNLGGTIIVFNEPGAECLSAVSSEGDDLDAEGDIDPDSQDI
ncbi:hypothetical protein M378DRAFT_199673 [Amanita muscaria Koide BX008]|uniref:Uncharacterized protein n=1 Tax=Amanita muscaria (strain Koide BX008) TaxID=946122 RepID=A0A0C2WHR6_AMAMK|nr:hypothetical protein M378DRAFT_199673 [Amanita muscaria Koide BX008]